MLSKPIVIYHGNCSDGFTAAWLVNLFLATTVPALPHSPDGWVLDHHPGVYNETPPDVSGRYVHVVDFSYPPEVMKALVEQAEFTVWIDHHKTAIDALADFTHPKLLKVVSTERSGAYLTSKHFWPTREPMELVKLVDDRDRWVFEDPRSRPFMAALHARPYTIANWNEASHNVERLVAEGEAIERANATRIAELLDQTIVWHEIDGQYVPTANLPYVSASDACQEMLRRFPEAPFACTWFQRKDGKHVHSLRSRPGSDVDVGVIAAKFGGGGHKHSAGFAL